MSKNLATEVIIQIVGVMCIDNHWVSQASVAQRKGRAGRCQAGESFHLFPRSKYEKFIDYSMPEILRTSLTRIVLDTKVGQHVLSRPF